MPLSYRIDPVTYVPQGLSPRAGLVALYALYDPRDGALCYIGKAVNPTLRLNKHMNPDGRAKQFRCARWTLGLKAVSLKPIMLILEWTGPDQWRDAERAYIAQARADGIDLFNLSTGGDSGPGAHHGPGARAKVSAAQKGRVRTPEARAKIGAGQVGRTASVETRAKMSAAHRARALTPEGHAKLVKAAQAKRAPELRQKTSAQMRDIWAERRRDKTSKGDQLRMDCDC